ncbi:MAG: endonuclease/exonuclease/phosphatase family protein [Gammaproteobacteria bacterium]|nr:endonuclease/exonuclease/phosphatase family protein [Gammaproteobacteria bacterium]
MRIFKIPAYVYLFMNLSQAYAVPVAVGSFNVNSGRAPATTIAKQLFDHNIDIWGISESSEDWPVKILPIINMNPDRKIEAIKGTSGMNNNRLQIYYDSNKFRLISHTELDEMNPNKRVRAPLVAQFEDLRTNQQFLFMINHLYRRDNDARLVQAQQINEWTKKQSLPVIAVGDYNFDLSPIDITNHDRGYDELTKNNIFTWIQPSKLLPTQCSSYKSILDFIFVSNKLHYISASSVISYAEKNYCNPANKYSDHRPITAIIDFE